VRITFNRERRLLLASTKVHGQSSVLVRITISSTAYS